MRLEIGSWIAQMSVSKTLSTMKHEASGWAQPSMEARNLNRNPGTPWAIVVEVTI